MNDRLDLPKESDLFGAGGGIRTHEGLPHGITHRIDEPDLEFRAF